MPDRPGGPHLWKQWLKRRLTRWRTAWIERFHPFDPADLSQLLTRMGIRSGDVVLVHVSHNHFTGFRGGPVDVIKVLQAAVGDSGTVLMPTLPFRGSALAYARSGAITDLTRSPSTTGLITEIFRRMPGVLRSIHPTHPVAAWGARAAQMIQDHQLAGSPCGHPSPYLRLLDVAGKIVFLGAPFRTLTFYHTVEELLEPQFATSPFTAEWFELQTRDRTGQLWTTTTRLFDPQLSGRRDLAPLLGRLRATSALQQGRVGRLPVLVVGAPEIVEASRQLLAEGVNLYARKR